jgi:thermostable 8-oxoguanine DNA glycosylase
MKKFTHLDELHSAFEHRAGAIRRRLAEYRRVPAEKYFYELIYCLMTPQSSAVNAGKAQKKFEEMRFFERDADPDRCSDRGTITFGSIKRKRNGSWR